MVRLALGEVPRADDGRWLTRTLAREVLGGLLRVWGDVGVLGALDRIMALTLEDLLALEGLGGWADGALRGAVARVQDLPAGMRRVWGRCGGAWRSCWRRDGVVGCSGGRWWCSGH
ncbi:hypothetical protein DEGR_38730 (plasmid) [Deinococcus grandis]|nr:hypothetical protein DEGR_38730 [Deinococcus grandis]